MTRLRTPNQKKKYEALKGRLNQYSYLVQTVYDTLNEEAAKIAASTGYDGEREFKWSDYPATKKRIDTLQQRFVNELQGIIHTGTSKEWKESNLVQDLLAGRVLKYYDVVAHGNKYKKLYYQTNLDALQAFQERVENGMSLSDRVWSQAVGYRRELECAISTGVERGMSAVTLSKRISKYLTDFPTLQADYKERYGKVVDCLNCEYRSMRLARTEINMAYRVAEQKRWSQFDFVLGYEIKLSGSHPVTDICDSLKGRYPKDFKFVGWHPNCYCYCIPILKTEEEFWSDDEVTGVEEPPKSFGEWIKDNEERLEQAAERGTLPYWYTDNTQYVKQTRQQSFDLLAMPDKLPEQYRIRFDNLLEIARENMTDNPPTLRTFEVNVKRLAEMIADDDIRPRVEEQMGDFFLSSMDGYAKGQSTYMLEDFVSKLMKTTGYVRPTLPNSILPKTGSLPCNASKLSEYLNSIESVEQFYIKTGYKSYDEFFNSLGGRDAIEKKLADIAEESRVYMCLNVSTLEKKIIAGDHRFKNSLETGKGSFKTIGEERAVKERIMFGMPDDVSNEMMPKYGFMAGKDAMDYEDIVAFGYGDTYVRFKDSAVRKRTSITFGDSYDGNRLASVSKGYSKSTPIAALDDMNAEFSLGMLSHKAYRMEEVAKTLKNVTSFAECHMGTYVEAQIYGKLEIEDVDVIYTQSKKSKASLEKALKKQKLEIRVVPCKYDTRLKYLEDGFTNYDGLASKYAHSLTSDDVDALGDFYINGLCKRFATPENLFWGKIDMPDDFIETMKSIAAGKASQTDKRGWLKAFYEEMSKKGEGKFPKVWWNDYSPKYGGWTSDVLNENILKRTE